MKLETILLIILFLFSFTIVQAQKTKKTVKKTEQETVNQETQYYNEYYITVEIDENSKIKVTVQEHYDADFIGNPESTKVLENFFSTLSQQKPKERYRPVVIVKPHPVLKYQEVINVIRKIRTPLLQIIIVEVSKDKFAKIPKLPTKADLLRQLRPNPLTLVVELDKNRNIVLNNEEMGKIDELSKLKNRLSGVFKDREDMGVFSEGTNEVEKGIYVRAPLSTIFFDIIKIVETLKDAGSTSIILQVDDLPL